MVKKMNNKENNGMDDVNNIEYVPTALSLLERDELVMSDVQKEILEEEISELKEIKEGEINIAGIYTFDLGEKIEVKAYIRNGLAKSVNIGNIPLAISNSKNEILAYQVFDLSNLGNIPAHSARPVKLYFEKENVNVAKIDMNDWNIAFDMKVKVSRKIKTQYENLPDEIEEKDKLLYEKFLNELPELTEGEFSISTFSIGFQKDGNILVTLVMRNGNNKSLSMEKLPIIIKNASGVVVKSEIFELSNFSIEPFKAKLCNFAIPAAVRLGEDAALKDWTVSFKLEELGSKSN